MCSSFSWSRPTVDSVHDHSKNIANVCVLGGRTTESLKGDLVSNAYLLGMEKSEKVKWQEALMSCFIDVVSC